MRPLKSGHFPWVDCKTQKYIYCVTPRKEWGGKARIRLTKMSPYDMNLLKNVAH